jgi:hypothetical protein
MPWPLLDVFVVLSRLQPSFRRLFSISSPALLQPNSISFTNVAIVTGDIIDPTVTVRVPAATALTDSPWWFSRNVFITSLPPLTTIYTPATECVDRWMVGPGSSVCDRLGCPNSTVQDVSVFSVNPRKKIVSDVLYQSCQAFVALSYSPGVCPSGHTIAEVTAYHINVMTSGGVHMYWQASCCKRSE